MKKVVITFDVEPDLHTNRYDSVLELPNLSKLLAKYNCKGVFFVTCDCIEKYPQIFKNLKEQGQTKSDLVETVKKDRDYYKKNWNTCEKDFTTMANKSKRKGLYMKLALVAIPVAFVAGLFIL